MTGQTVGRAWTVPSESVVAIGSNSRVGYGERIAVIGTARRQGGQWIASALLPSSGVEDVRVEHGQVPPGTFIVIRAQASGGVYTLYAVPEQRLEAQSDEVELQTVAFLRTHLRPR